MAEVRADGTVPPQDLPNPPPQPVKKTSKFWEHVKWLGGGIVLGIAGYEGLKFWKRLRGEGPERNPEAAAIESPSPSPSMGMGGMGMGMGPSVMPQILPIPQPVPYPYPQPHPPAPPAAAAPAPDLEADLSPKERRARNRQRKLEKRLADLEAILEDSEY